MIRFGVSLSGIEWSGMDGGGMVLARGLVACVVLAGVVVAQSTPARPRRPASASNTPVTDGCPAAGTLPVPVAYSATAADYVELRRTDCVGGCPAYTVRVYGDGRVNWLGNKDVVMTGAATGSIDAIGAKALIQEVVSRGFWGLCSAYSKGGAEVPSYVTTVQVGGQVRRVEDRGNVAPAWVRSIDAEVDELADSHRWRHGDANRETFGMNRALEDVLWPKVGVTRLMKVAVAGTGELGEMLADTTENVDAVDSSGWTALMYVAQAGGLDALKMLIARRADVSRRSNAGETAMSAAVSSTVEPNPQEKVRVLWAAGLNINAADNRGVTPLMLAAERVDRPELVAAMMKLGADPTKRDADGNSALDYLKTQDVMRQRMPENYEAVRRMLVVPASVPAAR